VTVETPAIEASPPAEIEAVADVAEAVADSAVASRKSKALAMLRLPKFTPRRNRLGSKQTEKGTWHGGTKG
jgi:hypothetical protein